MRLNAKQIVACTGGDFVVEPRDASLLATGLTWDSRTVNPGDVYVALLGERVDGHAFVAQALQAGACMALTMQPLGQDVKDLAVELGAAIIEVPNTHSAVTDIAREWRGHLRGRIIGVTGSVGKTTTKNLIRDVLSSEFATVATAGNQNNDLGVPKTLLNADADTQMVVLEMGMDHAGEIAQLCQFARPDWGVIVFVGESHIELLGSRENIACAKAELFEALPEGCGKAFLNAASDFADFIKEQSHLTARRVETTMFDGSSQAADRRAAADPLSGPAVWAEDIRLDDWGRPLFRLCATGFDVPGVNGAQMVERVDCVLNLRGLHNVGNACAAVAVGLAAGLKLQAIADVLASVQPESGRQEILQAPLGYTVINDAYNAAPDSMQASLAMFCAMKCHGRRVAVLGDMGELGDCAAAGHERVGLFAATQPLDRLVCVGSLSNLIADAAIRAGMDEEKITRLPQASDVLGDLSEYLREGDAVLVKASHFMGLESVAKELVR